MNDSYFYNYQSDDRFIDSSYILLTSVVLLTTVILKREIYHYLKIVVYTKYFTLIAALIVSNIVLNTEKFQALRSFHHNIPLSLPSTIYFPIYILKLLFESRGKTPVKHVLVILLFCAVLIINGCAVSLIMGFFYPGMSTIQIIVLASTLSTTQPDCIIRFLALNNRKYQKVIDYLSGESVLSLLLIFPMSENIYQDAIYHKSQVATTLWFFIFCHFVSIGFGWFVAQLMCLLLGNFLLNLETAVSIIFGGICFAYIASQMISISAFTTGLVYCMVLKTQSSLALESIEESFRYFLSIAYCIADNAVSFYAVSQGIIHAWESSLLNIYFYCYLIAICFRVVTVLAINFLLVRFDRVDFLQLYLHSVVCPTSMFSLMFAMEVYFQKPEIGKIVYAHAIFNTFAANILNNFIGINLLRLMGVGQISEAGVTNMERTLIIVKQYRDDLVTRCKRDINLAQVNWRVVNKYTTLTLAYPYPNLSKKIDWENKLRIYPPEGKEFCCESCPQISSLTPVRIFVSEVRKQRKVMMDLTRSALKRMMKQCYLTDDCHRAIKASIDAHEADMTKSPLQVIHDFLKPKPLVKWLKFLSRFLNSSHTPQSVPRRAFYRNFARLQVNIIYQITNHLITVTVLFPILLRMMLRERYEMSALYLLIAGVLFFVFDMFVNIFSLTTLHLVEGITNYFKSFWYIMEFISVIGALIQVILFIYPTDPVLDAFDYMKFARVFRLMRSIRLLLPNFFFMMSFGTDMRKMIGYQCALALNEAINETLLYVSRWRKDVKAEVLFSAKDIFVDYCNELQQIIMRIEAELPEATSSCKTNMILNAGRCHINECLIKLKLHGAIDTHTFNYLRKAIATDDQQKRSIPPINSTLLFYNNYWIGMCQEAAELLRSNAVMKEWPPGHVLVQAGKRVQGVYLLIGGHLRIYNIKTKRSLRHISFVEFENNIISPGNSFGEIELLTGENYKYTLVCEGKCRTYFMDGAVVCQALLANTHPINGIDATIWKRKMMYLAIQILMEQTYYRFEDVWTIKKDLQRAFVPDLRCYNVFPYVDTISDIILLEGFATNLTTEEMYVAPKYIHRTAVKLALHQSNPRFMREDYHLSAKLMILPLPTVDAHAVLVQVEEAAEMRANHNMSTCPYHVRGVSDRSPQRRKMAEFDAEEFQMPEEFSVNFLTADLDYERRMANTSTTVDASLIY